MRSYPKNILKSYQSFITSVLYKYTIETKRTFLNAPTTVIPPAPPGAFWEQNCSLQAWYAEGRSRGFLDLSQNPSAFLANKIPIRRKKKKPQCYGQPLRCCPLLCSQKRLDLKAQCSENRWRARYFSGHCFKGAVVEDRAAILVATCVG